MLTKKVLIFDVISNNIENIIAVLCPELPNAYRISVPGTGGYPAAQLKFF